MKAPPFLRLGESPPHTWIKSNRNPRFATSSFGGTYVLWISAPDLAAAAPAVAAFATLNPQENERLICLMISDPHAPNIPGLEEFTRKHIVFDDRTREAHVFMRFAGQPGGDDGRIWLFDPLMRVMAFWPFKDHAEAIRVLHLLPPARDHAITPTTPPAPVLIAPRIFEPAFCRMLIETHEKAGGTLTGATRQREDGTTYVEIDQTFKRRYDHMLQDEKLALGARWRIHWRLLPMIERYFMARMTRMERYLVACYDAERGGFFKPHRDNTTKGTAHRRFAVTINLNAEDYEGGDLNFPEFGTQTYRAPTGGAVVFSCGMLHQATPMIRGKRYAFLPFLYDDAAAELRAENEKFLDESVTEAEPF